MKPIRLVYVVTHPITAYNLMRGQLSFMRQEGMEVSLISSPEEELNLVEQREGIEVIPVRIEREIHLWKDLVALVAIFRSLRKLKPDIVNAGTPKAGLLGMLAARMAGVPVRIYTLRGLRLETKKGAARRVLSFTERVSSACAHRVICVSESLRNKYIELGLVTNSKTILLGAGSSNGVDTNRFIPSEENDDSEKLRARLGITGGAPVIGFVGRLTHDKGVRELFEAFELLSASFPDLYLLILGDFEEADPVQAVYAKKLQEHPNIIMAGFIRSPAQYYQIMNVLLFTSHREGFPNAPLEAAASGIPTVGFRVTGTVDAIEDGVTGRLVPKGDIRKMAEAVLSYLKNDNLRREHGLAARDHVLRMFAQEKIWRSLQQQYVQLVMENETSQYRLYEHRSQG